MKRAASPFSCVRKQGSLTLVRLQQPDEVGGRDVAQEMPWLLHYRWVMMLLRHFFAMGIMAMGWPLGFMIHGEVLGVVSGAGGTHLGDAGPSGGAQDARLRDAQGSRWVRSHPEEA